MASPLEREFRYYLGNQDELAERHDGEFVVIKDEQVIGVYDDHATAVFETQKVHALGTFLVQQVGRGPDAHTQVFHSRVAFSGSSH